MASTTNELLYYTYKMNHAEDDEEKLYYLENVLSMFSGTFFSQMWYAEFEDYMYQIVESGSALDPEVLGDKWMELLDTYRGDAIIAYPDARYAWSEVPHFYYVYYVYQYASSVCYASSIAEGILNGEEGAVESYLNAAPIPPRYCFPPRVSTRCLRTPTGQPWIISAAWWMNTIAWSTPSCPPKDRTKPLTPSDFGIQMTNAGLKKLAQTHRE